MAKKHVYQLGKSEIEEMKRLLTVELKLEEKAELLRVRLAERIAEVAQKGFNSANNTDQPAPPSVNVTVQPNHNVTVVLASGEDAVFIEFGTGIFYNGGAGTSPHPKGAKTHMTIGSYGQGKGKRKAWGFYDDNGGLTITHGIPAQMPLWKAYTEVIQDLKKIASEVFYD